MTLTQDPPVNTHLVNGLPSVMISYTNAGILFLPF